MPGNRFKTKEDGGGAFDKKTKPKKGKKSLNKEKKNEMKKGRKY